MTPIIELRAEKIAEAIFLLVFRIAFPPSLLAPYMIKVFSQNRIRHVILLPTTTLNRAKLVDSSFPFEDIVEKPTSQEQVY